MKLIGLFVFATALGCLTAVFYLYEFPANHVPHAAVGSLGQSPQPTPATTPPGSTPPNHTSQPRTISQAYSSTSSITMLPTARFEQIVRFQDSAARDTFLATNHLTTSALTPIPELNAYALTNSQLTPSPGTSIYANRGYHASLTPTDPLASQQWHLARVNATTAWNHQIGSSTATVAVVDTGFALYHEDLAQAWVSNSGETGSTISEGPAPNCTSRGLTLDKSCNNLDDDGNGYVDDTLGWDFADGNNNVQAGKTNSAGSAASHGTMTSGLIAAAANNAKGDTGMNWNARVLPVQALDDDGNGTTLSVSLGVRYAVDQGARVISLSLGGNSDDPILAEQINYALTHNVVVVAAAGNDGCNCLSYPAAYTGVISVGATTTTNTRASFSSYGARLDIMAPGTSICTTAWTAAQPINSYVCGVAGTSFSTPITAGAASLLLSQNTTLTPTQVRTAIISSATKLSGMNGANWTSTYGYGLLDTYAALASVSFATPNGQPISTHAIKLSQANSGIFAYLSDNLNSTCASNLSTALCHIRAINTATNQMIALSTNETATGLTNIDWQAGTDGLGFGQWLIQSYISLDGAQSLAREETLTISP